MKLISLLVDVRAVHYVNLADYEHFTHTKLDNLNLNFSLQSIFPKKILNV